MNGSEILINNPYVGPRPIETGERLFGRARELTELQYLLSAERIVLLHSPSGAGKSSLIQAGLIPRLRERFDVWRPTRVGHPLPAGVSGNRYVLSAMQGFEQGIPEGMRRGASELAGMRLAEYVEGRPRRPSAPEGVLIIFDQFEEVLTAEPLALAARREFFAQLGELLLNPMVWGLFSLREDYLAPLDPYAQAVPTHLKNRYRMDLLTREAAREAIVRPAEGRVWTDAAVDRLVRDLATVKVQQPDGAFALETGVYVEPMQLQVVCRGLWERMPADDLSVDPEDVAAFGDVTLALGRYYADEVGRIAGGDEREERGLREWVGEKLISIDGIRTPVLRSAGGREASIGRLVDAHLVRAEHRGGAVWYELAHDRLVGPVRADNERWAQAHLQPVQVQAALWARQGKPAALLLSEAALAEAERWAAQHAALAEADAEFMAASRAARGQERAVREAQARASAQQRVFTWIVGVLGVVAVVVASVAVVKNQEANEQAALARSKTEETQRETARTRDQGRLVAIRDVAGDPTEQAVLLREAERPAEMRQWLQVATEVRQQELAVAVLRHSEFSPPAISPDGRAIVTVDGDEWWLWDVERGQASRLAGHSGALTAYAFSPDGERMVLSSREGPPQIWSMSGGAPITLFGQRIVRAVAFSPDGTRVVTAADQDSLMVWPVDGGDPAELAMPGRVIDSVVFSPDGRSLLTFGEGAPWIWPIEGFERATSLPTEQWVRRAWFAADGQFVLAEYGDATVSALPIAGGEPRELGTLMGKSADGRRFATLDAPTDTRVRLWSTAELSRSTSVDSQVVKVIDVEYSPDGAALAILSSDNRLILRDIEGGQTAVMSGPIRSVAFSPDGRRVVTASGDGTVSIWRVADGATLAVLTAQARSMESAVFSPDGSRVLTWGRDATARVWRADGEGEAIVLAGHLRGISSAGFAADGRYVWTIEGYNEERTVRVWRVPSSEVNRPRVGEIADRMFAMSADGRSLAVSGGASRDVQVWRPGASGPRELRGSGPARDIQALAFSPDGGRLAVGYADAAVKIFDVEGEGRAIELRGHGGSIQAIAFSPDGTRVITGSSDFTARVWSAAGGPASTVLSRHGDLVIAVAFSPDGSRVVTGSVDRLVRVWRVDGGGLVELAGHQGGGATVAFSPDGTRVASGSTDGTVQVWRADNSDEPVVLRGAKEGVRAVAFSPDGGRVVGLDSAMRVWRSDGVGEAVVLGGRTLAAAFSADDRVTTLEMDGAVREWTLCSTEACGEWFWRGTSHCLSADRRSELLGEERAAAERNMADCRGRVATLAAQGVYR